MVVATWAVLLVLLLAMSVAYAAMARTAWIDSRISKKNLKSAELQYEMTKAKYEAWLESNQKIGGSE